MTRQNLQETNNLSYHISNVGDIRGINSYVQYSIEKGICNSFNDIDIDTSWSTKKVRSLNYARDIMKRKPRKTQQCYQILGNSRILITMQSFNEPP